jgi:hypothetical protein
MSGPNYAFHTAISRGEYTIVKHFMCTFVNPLLPDTMGRLPIDLTTDPILIRELQEYAKWDATIPKTRWFGPFFERRARTCMLLCLRFNIPRHVGYIIIRHFAPSERVYLDYIPVVNVKE